MDGTRYGSRVPQRTDHWHAVKGGFENCCAGDCAEAALREFTNQDLKDLRESLGQMARGEGRVVRSEDLRNMPEDEAALLKWTREQQNT